MSASNSATTLTTSEAKGHAGESATVYGTVSGVHFSADSKGQPTFINLDGSYPKGVFSIVILEEKRSSFRDIDGALEQWPASPHLHRVHLSDA